MTYLITTTSPQTQCKAAYSNRATALEALGVFFDSHHLAGRKPRIWGHNDVWHVQAGQVQHTMEAV